MSEPWMSEIDAHALAAYPNECCGLVASRRGPAGDFDLAAHPCVNIQDRLHAESPLRFPRTARTAYHLDPADLIRVDGEARRAGGRIVAVYHSHTVGGASFSRADHDDAVSDGEPLFPGIDYLVIAVGEAGVRERSRFRWQPRLKRFRSVSFQESLVSPPYASSPLASCRASSPFWG